MRRSRHACRGKERTKREKNSSGEKTQEKSNRKTVATHLGLGKNEHGKAW
jgi:hypothetical protein